MKKGFTLAETLITLGIIGVVAALTIPVLNLSTKEKTFEARLKVCVSDLENAFTTMMASEGAVDMNETVAIEENKIVDNLEKYLKIYKDSTENNKCKLKNGAEVTFAESKPSTLQDKDAKVIDSEDYVAYLTIDVNGSDKTGGKPNKEGFDIFNYAVLTSGLLQEAMTLKEEEGVEVLPQ